MTSDFEILDCGQEAGTRKVALIFRRDQLLYDIKNLCFVEGHTMADSGDELRHMVQDVGEEGNVDRITRVLDLAHADVVERLYPFTQREIRNPALDDRLREKPVYAIVLNVPDSFSQTTLNFLAKLIHEMLVCSAVADWLSITNPPKQDVWRQKVEAVCARIQQIKANRTSRHRIRPHWI